MQIICNLMQHFVLVKFGRHYFFNIICDTSQIWQFAYILNACNQPFQDFVQSTATSLV